jgi:hypothetical protein
MSRIAWRRLSGRVSAPQCQRRQSEFPMSTSSPPLLMWPQPVEAREPSTCPRRQSASGRGHGPVFSSKPAHRRVGNLVRSAQKVEDARYGQELYNYAPHAPQSPTDSACASCGATFAPWPRRSFSPSCFPGFFGKLPRKTTR